MNEKAVIVATTSGQTLATFSPGGAPSLSEKENLMSGLLSAIKSFVNALDHEELEMIETTGKRIVILPSMANGLLFVLVGGLDFDKSAGLALLESIRDGVIERYGNVLEKTSQGTDPGAVRGGIEAIARDLLAASDK
jgi:hypothetical protein